MRTLVLMVLAGAFCIQAETAIGGNLSLDFWSQNGNNNDHFAMEVVPSLVLMPTPTFEINPRAGFGVAHDEGANNTPFGLVAGCGFFFHVIDNQPFVLGLGPDINMRLGFDPSMGGFSVGMPVNLDVHLSSRLFARLSISVVSLGFHVNDDGTLRDNGTGFRIHTVQAPQVGLYFNL